MPKKPDFDPAEDDVTSAAEPGADTYRVKRIFQTIQGEGFWSGTPAVFVRMVGCNQWTGYEEDRERDAERHGSNCPRWCDTDFTPEGSDTYTAEELREAIEAESECTHVVFTGGEPLLQMDAPLVAELKEAGYYVHVETNGTVSLNDTFDGEGPAPDWVCCSPKLPEEQTIIEWADELKLIVPAYVPSNYEEVAERVIPIEMGGEWRRPLYVQPEDGPRLETAKKMAAGIAIAHHGWMVSTQSHKTLGID